MNIRKFLDYRYNIDLDVQFRAWQLAILLSGKRKKTRIKELRSKHKKIWYMADGIYSMFGDCSPVDEIYSLLNKYPEFYYYVDDAHGMSIHGKNGRGFVLGSHEIHKKMALATSLNKAFATGGGVLVYGDKELARKVGTVGGPLLSSGPMQPSALGAAIVSARIHLSDEIFVMQKQLKDNIEFTIQMLAKYQLPVDFLLESVCPNWAIIW